VGPALWDCGLGTTWPKTSFRSGPGNSPDLLNWSVPWWFLTRSGVPGPVPNPDPSLTLLLSL